MEDGHLVIEHGLLKKTKHAVPEAFAYAIPDAFGDVEATPLLCAGIIGFRALRRTELASGGRLGIYGFGSSAHLALQVARARGTEVYVATRGEKHRRLARELGAAWTGTRRRRRRSRSTPRSCSRRPGRSCRRLTLFGATATIRSAWRESSNDAKVDDIVKAVTAAGGAVAMPKMSVPGVGWTAYFTDTEGTLFGVMQFDPAAK